MYFRRPPNFILEAVKGRIHRVPRRDSRKKQSYQRCLPTRPLGKVLASLHTVIGARIMFHRKALMDNESGEGNGGPNIMSRNSQIKIVGATQGTRTRP